MRIVALIMAILGFAGLATGIMAVPSLVAAIMGTVLFLDMGHKP